MELKKSGFASFRAAVVLLAALTVLLSAPGWVAAAVPNRSIDPLPEQLRKSLEKPLQARLSELSKDENASGVKNKRGTYSRSFRKIDDSTYRGSFQVSTADVEDLLTERFDVTLTRDGKGWKISEEKLVDSYAGLHRVSGFNCYPIERFRFDRDGLRITASGGGMCEYYYKGEVAGFYVGSADLDYEYSPPDYLQTFPRGHEYPQLHGFLMEDHARDLIFTPQRAIFDCDPQTCETLIDESFTGLTRKPREQRTANDTGVPASLYGPLEKYMRDAVDDAERRRRDNPFAQFRTPYAPDNRVYTAALARTLDHSIGIRYDNWEGFEVTFFVFQETTDFEALNGPVFGYYTDETLKTAQPYELEKRDDQEARWFEVDSVVGAVDLGLEDPEMVEADLEFGLNFKNSTRELPFFIANAPRGEDRQNYRRPSLSVNSVQLDGEELTWVKTSPYGGLVVLPEPAAAGSHIKLHMNFSTRAIQKVNPAFSAMARFGWMPFVRFGDFVDEFDLVVRSPAKYTILGPGHKVAEQRKGNVLTSHWRADNPVVFPTIIFGKYESDKPSFDAKKLDGTVIPIEVHVDTVSMGVLKDASQLQMSDEQKGRLDETDVNTAIDQAQMLGDLAAGSRGIRGKQLRPIAEQAANAINLYSSLSGLDYPYGELNLVNDPSPALYGQAPSSLIYLGSFVFRGEGTMAGEGFTSEIITGRGGTQIAKFLKSVVAHEVGHQWWGSRVSNANGRNYWFVESLAEYFSALYLEAVFGKKDYQEQVDEWRAEILASGMQSSVQNASVLWNGGGFGPYRAAVYSKGPYAFHILRETFGDEKFFPFLKRFTLELAEKREIVTMDIQEAAQRALGGVDADGNEYHADLGWFFDQWIRGAGIPQFSFTYDVRPTEDGGYLVEGSIRQRVIVGTATKHHVLSDTFYRGFVDITIDAKGGDQFRQRLVVQGEETPFRLKVGAQPIEVALNKYGEILAHEVLVNRPF